MNEIKRIKWSIKLKKQGKLIEKQGCTIRPKDTWVFQNEGNMEFVEVKALVIKALVKAH